MFQKIKQFLKLFADKQSPRLSPVAPQVVERIAPTRVTLGSREMQATGETVNLSGKEFPLFHQHGNKRLPHILVNSTFIPLAHFRTSLQK